MILRRQLEFLDAQELQAINQELTSTAGWVWRERFWRYYLIDGLQPYQESNPATWYHNQSGALDRLKWPWRALFDRVFELAGPRFQLMRYALTGQTQNQYPVWHTDVSPDLPGTWRSYLIYLNDHYDRDWGGPTMLKPNHQEQPEPGKLIEFNSQVMHIGLPPRVPDFLRTTIVLHGHML